MVFTRFSAIAFTLMVLTTATHAQIIADLDADYNGLDPAPVGYSYLWNPTGFEIGDSANYAPLTLTGNAWQVDAEDPSDDLTNSSGFEGSSGGNSLRVNGERGDTLPEDQSVRWLISGLDSMNSTDQLDHYVIVGYTIQEGEVEEGGSPLRLITDGGVGGTDNGTNDNRNFGYEFRVYLNDTLLDSETFDAADVEPDFERAPTLRDRRIDFSADVGDTVYVAFLSDKQNTRNNGRRWFAQYTIGRIIPGDFDSNGVVNGNDFLVWQRTDGSAEGLAEWQSNYGEPSTPAVSGSTIPEPSTMTMLTLMGLVIGGSVRRRRG